MSEDIGQGLDLSDFWFLAECTESVSLPQKSWNVFIKNLNFFSTEERNTWTSWLTWGRVNYQQKFFLKK